MRARALLRVKGDVEKLELGEGEILLIRVKRATAGQFAEAVKAIEGGLNRAGVPRHRWVAVDDEHFEFLKLKLSPEAVSLRPVEPLA